MFGKNKFCGTCQYFVTDSNTSDVNCPVTCKKDKTFCIQQKKACSHYRKVKIPIDRDLTTKY